MSTKSGRLRRYAITTVTTAAVIAGLVIAGAPAYAQTGDPPPPEPWSVQIVTGPTVWAEAVVDKQPTASSESGVPTGSSGVSTVSVRGARNSGPTVHDVAPYTLPNMPGTFTKKVQFHQSNGVSAQNVLAADSSGKALDPSRVRTAYHTTLGQYWVFYPGTGTLEQVQAWPRVYPSPPARAAHSLASLFGGPGGPEWLDRARKIAVVIAAAVITGGAVAAFPPAVFVAVVLL